MSQIKEMGQFLTKMGGGIRDHYSKQIGPFTYAKTETMCNGSIVILRGVSVAVWFVVFTVQITTIK